MEKSEIIKMGYVIQDFLLKENHIDARSKDLMPLLIEKGFFKKDHKKRVAFKKFIKRSRSSK